MNMSEKLQDILLLIAEKVDENQYLSAIKNAFTAYMPFIIVGSFATLLNTLICSPKIGLAVLIPQLSAISPAFTAINFATMSFMTIAIVYLIAMNLAKSDKLPEHLAGITSICAYICVVPQVVLVVVKQTSEVLSGAGVSASATGAQGLFVGMLIAVLAEKIFKLLMHIDKIKIKMPSSVPHAISQSFNTLIPILITLCIIAIFGQLFVLFSGGVYINDFIYKIVQSPLEIIFQSPVGIVLVVIISQIFWFLGIHGGLVISPIRNPLIAAAIAANIAASAAGQVPNQPVTYGFWLNFVVPGGAGCILALIISIFVFSKREDHRMIAKLGFIPAVCGISEPVVFGLPLVLNPTFAIPFIFNSGITTAIAMIATNIGFLPCNTVDCPFGVPIFLSAFLGHGWQGVVVQLISLIITIITWIPFVIISNKQYKNEVIES